MALTPHLLMVKLAIILEAPSRAKIMPDMTSWTMRMKGITVMAVFSFFTMPDTRRPSTSEL